MTITQSARLTNNPAFMGLLIIGPILMIIGAIIGFAQKAAGDSAANVNAYKIAMGIGDAGPQDASYAAAWVGLAIAAFGLLILTSCGIIAAARRQ
jgi:hypothetical protein